MPETDRFLFVSLDAALITDLAWRVHSGGHPVKYYIAREADREIGDGFVPKSSDWRADLEWADVVVFDDIWVGNSVGTGKIAAELREEGNPVIGGTPATDRLEDDRGYGMQVLEEHGIETIPHRVFSDFESGIAFVNENPAPYVIKPLGEVQNVKRLLYVGREDDGSDVVAVLEAYERAWSERMKGFQLQRRVEGVEVAICGFFNGSEFIEPINVNFEHKRLFPGNLGPQTGEMGTSMIWTGRTELFAKTLGPLEDWLAAEGYVGSIDINCIANENGIFPLEFTPRFGYPTIAVQTAAIETAPGRFLGTLARGGDPDLDVHGGYQVGARLVVPPFPFDDPKTYDESSRNAAIVFEDEDRTGIHLEDVKRVNGQWRVAGENGMPLVVTGRGETMAEAREELQDRLDQVLIPNMYYRDDIGERWIDGDADRLQAWGYLGPASETR